MKILYENKPIDEGLTSAQRHNRKMDRIFQDKKGRDSRMSKFLKDNSDITDDELKKVQDDDKVGLELKNRGLHDRYWNEVEGKNESLKESYTKVDTIECGEDTYRVVGGGFNPTADALITVEDEHGERTRMHIGDVIEFYTWYDKNGNVIHEPSEDEIDESLNESQCNYVDKYKGATIYECDGKYAADINGTSVSGKSLDEIKKNIDKADTEYKKYFSNLPESCSKSLTEDISDEERIPALANYLNIPEDEIENLWDYEYQTPEGDYYVVTEEEAEELAKEDIRNLFDDLGLDSFAPDFKDWIIMNALDNDWFEDAVKESFEYYVEDIEDEASSMGYENRLIEEMHDHQVLSDEDFEIGEDGEPDLTTLKDDVDIDYLKEEFVDLLVENAGNPVDHCVDSYGWDWVTDAAINNNLIDMDEVVEQCIYEDGVAHFIARYDGEEHELGNGLYAYRTN